MAPKARIAVGLSGGVDSSVAAYLLVEQGFSVLGLTMKIWSGKLELREGSKHACYGPDEDKDIEACSALCSRLGIEYRVLDLSREYEERVLRHFRAEYLRGRTPNPCVICNKELKFGFLVERAREQGLDFDLFATGHYARIVERGRQSWLRKAADEAKDQSYFLYRLPSSLLAKVRFPLGELSKERVRAIARDHGLEAAEKAESQDFIAGGDYSPLFAESPPEEGDFVDIEGRVIGRHRGLPFYTIGQRRGLGLSSGSGALYVIRIDADSNRVIVGPGEGLFSEGLFVSELWLQDEAHRAAPFRALAKIRQNHRPVGCHVESLPDGACELRFDIAQRAVAPGQALVLYDEDGLVLGGGAIDRALGPAMPASP